MGEVIDKIQNEYIRSFLWRVWNTIKYPLLTIALGLTAKILADIVGAGTVTILLTWNYWDGILVTLATLLSGLIGVGGAAGIDKIKREIEKETQEVI